MPAEMAGVFAFFAEPASSLVRILNTVEILIFAVHFFFLMCGEKLVLVGIVNTVQQIPVGGPYLYERSSQVHSELLQ